MPIIEVSGLRKTYGRRRAVDDVGFTVHEGEIFGILGPNGAGKTTAVECLGGLRRPGAGTVRVAGLDPRARRDTWTLIDEIRDTGVTVVLVTHSMEEAQRLCDRVAVFTPNSASATPPRRSPPPTNGTCSPDAPPAALFRFSCRCLFGLRVAGRERIARRLYIVS